MKEKNERTPDKKEKKEKMVWINNRVDLLLWLTLGLKALEGLRKSWLTVMPVKGRVHLCFLDLQTQKKINKLKSNQRFSNPFHVYFHFASPQSNSSAVWHGRCCHPWLFAPHSGSGCRSGEGWRGVTSAYLKNFSGIDMNRPRQRI